MIRTIRLLLATLAIALMPQVALAAESRTDALVHVAANETIDDDLYAFGNAVDVMGTVNGDVVAFANTVTISGHVTGNVLVAAGTTTISGRVDGTVRGAAGNAIVEGNVGEDAILWAASALITPDARVGRDLWVGAGTATVRAPIDGNLLASGRNLTVASPVGGDLHARVDRLELADGAAIAGRLEYTSPQVASIAQGVSVLGGTSYTDSTPEVEANQPLASLGGIAVDWLRMFVGLLALGMVMVLVFPSFSGRAAHASALAPLKTLGVGAIVLIGTPIVALGLFVLGVFVGGWWLALLIVAAYILAVAVSLPVASLVAGRWLLRRAGHRQLARRVGAGARFGAPGERKRRAVAWRSGNCACSAARGRRCGTRPVRRSATNGSVDLNKVSAEEWKMPRLWRAICDTLKRLWKETGDDDVAGLAAALAYHFLLALFPFFIFLTALGGVVVIIVGGDNPSASVVRELGANLPPQIAEVVTRELQDVVRSASPSLLSVGVVGAVWATMAGIKSIMRAMNLAYDVPESRPFLKQNLVALGLSLLFGVFVLGAFALFVLGDVFTLQIASLLGLVPAW